MVYIIFYYFKYVIRSNSPDQGIFGFLFFAEVALNALILTLVNQFSYRHFYTKIVLRKKQFLVCEIGFIKL